MNLPRPVCPCGWEGAACTESAIPARLARHQRSKKCSARPARYACTLCGVETADKTGVCRGCRAARACKESPLNLRGRWVVVGGIRKWRP